MTFPIVGPVGLPYAVFIAQTADTSNASTYSFTSQSLGIESGDRMIAVVAAIRDDGGGSATVTSPTIGGVAATIGVQVSGGGNACAIFYLNVPTGTSATIAFACNSVTCERAWISVYAVYGLASFTPGDTDTVSADPGVFAALAVVPNGLVIAGAIAVTATAFTTVGLTEDADVAVEATIRCVSGSAAFSATNATATVSFDTDVTTRGAAAAWR